MAYFKRQIHMAKIRIIWRMLRERLDTDGGFGILAGYF